MAKEKGWRGKCTNIVGHRTFGWFHYSVNKLYNMKSNPHSSYNLGRTAVCSFCETRLYIQIGLILHSSLRNITLESL